MTRWVAEVKIADRSKWVVDIVIYTPKQGQYISITEAIAEGRDVHPMTNGATWYYVEYDDAEPLL